MRLEHSVEVGGIGVPLAHQDLPKHFLSPLRIPLKVKT